LAAIKKRKKLSNGEWNESDFARPADTKNLQWVVINYGDARNLPIYNAPHKNEVDDFVKKLVQNAVRNGLQLNQPNEIVYNEYYDGTIGDMDNMIHDLQYKYKNLRLIIVILPPDNDELYARLKYVTEVNYGILTQCVSQKTKKKPGPGPPIRVFNEDSYVRNLILKVNSKLGGLNCVLNPESKIGHLKKRTMIMGLDVTHPAKHDRLGNSVASAVATFDNDFVNFYAKTVVQPKPRQEIVDLEAITIEFLDNFFESTKSYPAYLLVYRDGVSDGQFNEVIEKEINLMKKAFLFISNEKKIEYNPKITYIIVLKRHHTRFLPSNEKDRDFKSENAKPGLIVDQGINSNFYSDFYLCAHRGALGTTRPTRYTILYDQSGFSVDDIQKVTYYLCHLFPRCMKTISLVPAVNYSHHAAKRGRSYLSVLDHTLDNRGGSIFGEKELTPEEIEDRNKRIQVHDNLIHTLYFI